MKSSLNRNILFSRILVIIIFLFLSHLNCANVQAPPGGPEDKKPPAILSVKPEGGTVNVPVDTEFEIVFSKNMNEQSAENAVFISPLFFNYPRFKWSGKKLKVIPPEKLRENTTYVLTIGALAQDSRGNSLGESMSYPFSTGNEIYRCSIFGEVLNKNTQKLNVWAYKLENANPDTFWMKIPDYVTQPDSMGRFKFEYLSYGTYLIVAAEDKNSDQFWSPPGERLALPDRLAELFTEGQEYGPLVMMTTERDTLQPFISGARSADNRSVVLTFSQPMDSSQVFSTVNYLIYPADQEERLAVIEYIYALDDDLRSIYIRLFSLIDKVKYKVIARNLESVYGVPIDTVSRFFNAGLEDSVRPELLMLEPEPPLRPRRAGFDIEMLFSEPMDTSRTDDKFGLIDTLNNTIPFQYEWAYLNKLILKPDLIGGEKYILRFDENLLLDLRGNALGDSIKEYNYVTATPDSFGQVLGKIVNVPNENVKVVIKAKDTDEISQKINSDGSFQVDRLFPGVYNLWAFHDKNNNDKYDGGNIRSFDFAESIVIYPDTIKVRARWETDIGVLDFNPSINDVDYIR